MRYGSLFSGIGGFDLGLDRAGMECTWQVEINPYANEVLARHWPNTPRYKDVSNVKFQRYNTYSRRDADWHDWPSESVDLVCGGFPCQDVSTAGRRAGLAGSRSGLWFEFRRLLAELKPEWVVVENVPGLLSSNGGRDFAVVIQGLVELRYGVCWRVLDAQYFGVPQRRRRVFIVGHLGDGRASEVLFEHRGVSGNYSPRRRAGKDTAYTLRAKPSHGGKGDGGININLVTGTLGAGGGRNRNLGNENELDFLVPATSIPRGDPETGKLIADTLQSRYAKGVGGSRGDMAGNLIADTVTSTYHKGRGTSSGNNGRPHNLIPFDTTQITSKANASNPQPGDPCHPLASSAHPPAVAGSIGVRRLTPTECERLQGFPDGWTAGHSDTQRYTMLGNAVAVPVAEWVGKRIMEVFN